MPIYWIIILLLVLLAAAVLATSYIFSGIVVHSRRQPIVRTPKEYGMAYENIEFKRSVKGE